MIKAGNNQAIKLILVLLLLFFFFMSLYPAGSFAIGVTFDTYRISCSIERPFFPPCPGGFLGLLSQDQVQKMGTRGDHGPSKAFTAPGSFFSQKHRHGQFEFKFNCCLVCQCSTQLEQFRENRGARKNSGANPEPPAFSFFVFLYPFGILNFNVPSCGQVAHFFDLKVWSPDGSHRHPGSFFNAKPAVPPLGSGGSFLS